MPFAKNSPEVLNAKLIDEASPEFVEIRNVQILTTAGRQLAKLNSGWSQPMFEIETNKGVYIAQPGLYGMPNLPEFIFQKICIYTEDARKAPGWKWLHLSKDTNRFLIPLAKAVTATLPEKDCYVYMITCEAERYVGFTTLEPPELRLAQHLELADAFKKPKSNQPEHTQTKLHLRLLEAAKRGINPQFSILGKFNHEIHALYAERKFIELFECSLNKSNGGEGHCFSIDDEHNVLDKNGWFQSLKFSNS